MSGVLDVSTFTPSTHFPNGFFPSGLPVRIAGEVPGFDAKTFVEKKERKSLRMMARTIEFAVAAAQLALSQRGLLFTGVKGGGVSPPQSFTVLNTGSGSFNWSATAITFPSGGHWLSAPAETRLLRAGVAL